MRHYHRPATFVHCRATTQTTYWVYACECGELLPERTRPLTDLPTTKITEPVELPAPQAVADTPAPVITRQDHHHRRNEMIGQRAASDGHVIRRYSCVDPSCAHIIESE